MLNDAVREDIAASVLCWLATVDAEGQPNVSPKEMFCAHGDDSLVIADIASPVSVRNIATNPRVSVAFIDVFAQKGFKIAGHARLIERDDPDFERYGAQLLAMAGPDFHVRRVIHVAITKIARIWAPSYALFPDRTPEERYERGLATYGVRRA